MEHIGMTDPQDSSPSLPGNRGPLANPRPCVPPPPHPPMHASPVPIPGHNLVGSPVSLPPSQQMLLHLPNSPIGWMNSQPLIHSLANHTPLVQMYPPSTGHHVAPSPSISQTATSPSSAVNPAVNPIDSSQRPSTENVSNPSDRGRSQGSRKQGGGGKSTKSKKRAPVISWRNVKNKDGKSSLDLIVEWLTVEGNFERWRSSECSKRQVAEVIAEYLKINGFPNRDSKGVEQQVTGLEKTFREALQWREQTGQGILDEAEEKEKNRGDPNSDDDEDYVGAAKSQTEAYIKKICPYYYDLEPVMISRPNARPLAVHELGDNEDIGMIDAALGVTQDTHQKTPSEWSLSDGEDDSGLRNQIPSNNARTESMTEYTRPQVNSQSVSTSDLRNKDTSNPSHDTSHDQSLTQSTSQPSSQSAHTRARPSAMDPNGAGQVENQRKKRRTYAEEFADRILPSKEQMQQDRELDRLMIEHMQASDVQLAQAASQIAGALRGDNGGSGDDPELHRLAIREREVRLAMNEMELKKSEIELKRVQHEVDRREKDAGAFDRARMIQDFLKSGLLLQEAISTTNDLLGHKDALS